MPTSLHTAPVLEVTPASVRRAPRTRRGRGVALPLRVARGLLFAGLLPGALLSL